MSTSFVWEIQILTQNNRRLLCCGYMHKHYHKTIPLDIITLIQYFYRFNKRSQRFEIDDVPQNWYMLEFYLKCNDYNTKGGIALDICCGGPCINSAFPVSFKVWLKQLNIEWRGTGYVGGEENKCCVLSEGALNIKDIENLNQLTFDHEVTILNTAAHCVQRLKRLKVLYDNELITQQDFETRKSKIVDELTAPAPSSSTIKHNRREHKGLQITRHPAPDWSQIRSEKAQKWVYSYKEQMWCSEQCRIKIDQVPFDKGGLRYVFHLHDVSNPEKKYVAKMSQDMTDNIKKEIYFNEVRMQVIARHFCHGEKGYNSYDPPVKVDFSQVYVLHLKQRQGSPVCHVEPYMEGAHTRYTNGVGWTSDARRNTPQAFAHFTYEASKGKLVVCDIQQVGDMYCDPQVQTSSMGYRYNNFLRTHRCNPLCQYLKLKRLPIGDMNRRSANDGLIDFTFLELENTQSTANDPLLSKNSNRFTKINLDSNDKGGSSSCCSRCIVL